MESLHKRSIRLNNINSDDDANTTHNESLIVSENNNPEGEVKKKKKRIFGWFRKSNYREWYINISNMKLIKDRYFEKIYCKQIRTIFVPTLQSTLASPSLCLFFCLATLFFLSRRAFLSLSSLREVIMQFDGWIGI